MRFWSIQMLFLSMPKFVFHAYITLVINNKKVLDRACEKLKETETEARADFSDDDSSVRNSHYSDVKTARAYEKIEKKKKKYMIRESQIKKKNHVDDRGNLEEVIWTPGIRLGYLVHLFFQEMIFKIYRKKIKFRAAIEALFLWLAYKLQQNQTRKTGWKSFRVPERYDCFSDEHIKPPWGDESVTACGQSKEIPCWVSRPWEKSLFVLYMSQFCSFKFNLTYF
ncbi:unnamed protein product [Oikopleura dioica]|uniref:Connexin N-terminal domain-containing protein n=1 Tax=Oikopleura dioica TaxID=34765 RepID=E4X507_OIKDI|nr:unnamed protein product [Oikopleura dioica]